MRGSIRGEVDDHSDDPQGCRKRHHHELHQHAKADGSEDGTAGAEGLRDQRRGPPGRMGKTVPSTAMVVRRPAATVTMISVVVMPPSRLPRQVDLTGQLLNLREEVKRLC